jgi:hypothetical protein
MKSTVNKAVKKYDVIYKEYYRKCKTNLNVERARLKRDTALYNVITLMMTIFAIYASVAYMEDQKYQLFVTIIILGVVGTKAAFQGGDNEFKMSVLEDILQEKNKKIE